MKVIMFTIYLCVSTCAFSAQVDSTSYYRHKCDSLKERLFIADFKVQKVKFYIGLVDKHPKNVRYLKGWIIRAVK